MDWFNGRICRWFSHGFFPWILSHEIPAFPPLNQSIELPRSPSAMVSLRHPPRFGLRSCGTSNWWSASEAPGSDTTSSTLRTWFHVVWDSPNKKKSENPYWQNGWLLYAIGRMPIRMPIGCCSHHFSLIWSAAQADHCITEVVLPSKTGANESTWTNGDSNLGNLEIQSTAFLHLGYLYHSPSKFGGILYPIALSRTWKRGICTDFECRCHRSLATSGPKLHRLPLVSGKRRCSDSQDPYSAQAFGAFPFHASGQNLQLGSFEDRSISAWARNPWRP